MHYIKKKEITLLLLLCVICLSSCSTEEYQSYKAGLFTGIWDGFIFLFTIIGKCFSTDINIFTEQNTGSEYWLGYSLGVGVFCLGGALVSK